MIFNTAYQQSGSDSGSALNLNDLTWDTIKNISDAGLAKEFLHEGDTKTIYLNGNIYNTCTFDNLAIDAFIIGIDHNSELEGSNRIHFMLGKIDGTDVSLRDYSFDEMVAEGAFYMNTSKTNSGGWEKCCMRTDMLGNSNTPTDPPTNSLMAVLPSDLRAVLKPVTKYTDNVGNNSGNVLANVTATEDYLFLPTEFEVLGERWYTNYYEQNYQKQYAYFAAGNSAIANDHRYEGDAKDWWLRSPDRFNATSFASINSYGKYSYVYANTPSGVRPCFCV